MEIWLKGSKKLRLPVLPESYSVTEDQQVEIVNVNALGDIDLGGNRGLESISLSSFFPRQYDAGYCEYRNLKSPKECVEIIKTLKREGVIRLIITGTRIRTQVRITSFEYSENDGTGDVFYSIEFTEHRQVPIGVSSVVTLADADGQAAQEPGEESNRTEPDTSSVQTYTVKEGDCLSSIARRMTGAADWRSIYEQNKDTIGGNPNLIYPGQVLTITGAKTDEGQTV